MKKIGKTTLLAFILTLVPTIVFSQLQYRFDQISREEGLSNASISSIVQDQYGFLWFGTQGGLNRYDGKNIKVYDHDPFDRNSLPRDLIQTLYLEKERDILWIGTYHGLSRFDILNEKFTNYKHKYNESDSLSNDIVTSIVKTRDGTLWVGTLEGLNRFNPEEGTFTRYYHEEDDPGSVSHNTIRDLMVDSDNNLWVGTYGGLDRYAPRTDSFAHYKHDPEDPDSLPAAAVMSILQDSNGTIWAGTWGGGLSRLDRRTGSFETVSLAQNKIYTLKEDREGNLWAGTWGGGLFRYNPNSNKIQRFQNDQENPDSISHDVIYSIYQDEAGLLWIGTNGNGVNKLNTRKRNYRAFHHDPNNPHGLNMGKIYSILEDSRKDLWIGIYNGGVNRFDPKKNRMFRYSHDPSDPNSLSNDIVNYIYEDSREDIWITTNDGLNRYRRETDDFEHFYHDDEDSGSISGDITYGAGEDSEGNLWIGTYSNGINRYIREENRFISYRHDPEDPKSISDNLVYDIKRDSLGNLWVATNNGLNRYNPETDDFKRFLHNPQDPSTLSSNTTRIIFEDNEGILWIGTMSGGLNRYNRETGEFTYYSREDGMPSNSVLGILEDDQGRLWLSTLYGISVFDKQTETFRNLDEDDGLYGMEFNPGHEKDSKGRLLFGGIHGITRIDTKKIMGNPHPPKVHITSVDILNRPASLDEPVLLTDSLELSYEDKMVSFEFIALDYASPAKNRYAYRLVGFDQDWVYSGKRNFVSYTNLKPGEYTFEVKASNNDGLWNEKGDSLRITVQPPWWRQWWAFAIYGVVLIVIFYLIIELRSKRLLTQKINELEDTKARLTEANRKLEYLSNRDSLTGIYNRGYFDSRIQDEWNRSLRNGSPLSLLMIDIDYFKNYNDNYGHQKGDQALKIIAESISSATDRSTDFVARYGGEEFVLVLVNTDKEGALYIAERVLDLVRERKILHEFSDAASILTVSIGVHSRQPKANQKIEEFVAAADQALYKAKRRGRNRIEYS